MQTVIFYDQGSVAEHTTVLHGSTLHTERFHEADHMKARRAARLGLVGDILPTPHEHEGMFDG
jgi:hypothetical protein